MRSWLLATAVALAGGSSCLAMTVTSHDFANGGRMPQADYDRGCGGKDVSPQLSWSGAPKAAKSLAVTMIDQDVKPSKWTHWIIVDLPLNSTALSRGVVGIPAPGIAVPTNMGPASYSGPCPPAGSGVHHYNITVWALPTAKTTIAPGAKADAVEEQLNHAAIDHAAIVGTAQR
ncbi:MAG: YbhB/YbcL family Raf kinase inhibitor-like protein [Caulobacteraceae bacterium]|nr:YbhB/YbcL family Raf kinase inhibitor-like protein [Caulobacteraceae bacterium]